MPETEIQLRKVKCTFHSVKIPEAVRSDYDSLNVLLREIPSKLNSIASGDSKIFCDGGLRIENNMLVGALAKVQTVNLPGEFYLEDNELKNLDTGNIGTRCCFVYNLQDEVLMIQSGGVSVSAWSTFIEVNFKVNLEHSILINPSNINEVLLKPSIKKISVKINRVSIGDALEGEQIASKDLKKLVEHTNASEINLTLGNNKEGLARSIINPLLQKLHRHISTGEVSDLKVTGGDLEAEAGELYDLVTNQLTDTIEIEKTKNITDVSKSVIIGKLVEKYNEHSNNIRLFYHAKD